MRKDTALIAAVSLISFRFLRYLANFPQAGSIAHSGVVIERESFEAKVVISTQTIQRRVMALEDISGTFHSPILPGMTSMCVNLPLGHLCSTDGHSSNILASLRRQKP